MYKSEICRLHCVLVHGTFANDATWVETDSPLAQALIRLEPNAVKVTNFRWTGYNTHAARVQAAEDLSVHLALAASEDPECKILLVGHSHGGNIILKAADAIPTKLRAGAVCLASPFFHVRQRSTSAIFWMIFGSALAAFATFHNFMIAEFMSFTERLSLTWLEKIIDWFPSYPDAVHSVGRVTSSFGGASMAIFMTVAILFFVGLSRIDAKYDGQQLACDRWDALRPTQIRTLCMWLAPDEAYWGLATARIVAESAHHVVFAATRYLLPAVAFVAMAGGFWFGWSRGIESTLHSAEIRAATAAMQGVQLGGLVMVLVPLLLIGFAALLSIFRVISTGTDRFADFMWLDIHTQRSPQIHASLVTGRSLPLTGGGLLDSLKAAIPLLSGPIFHSRLYSDNRAFNEIVKWYVEQNVDAAKD